MHCRVSHPRPPQAQAQALLGTGYGFLQQQSGALPALLTAQPQHPACRCAFPRQLLTAPPTPPHPTPSHTKEEPLPCSTTGVNTHTHTHTPTPPTPPLPHVYTNEGPRAHQPLSTNHPPLPSPPHTPTTPHPPVHRQRVGCRQLSVVCKGGRLCCRAWGCVQDLVGYVADGGLYQLSDGLCGGVWG